MVEYEEGGRRSFILILKDEGQGMEEIEGVLGEFMPKGRNKGGPSGGA